LILLLPCRRPKKKKKARKASSPVKDASPTEAPSSKEAEGEAIAAGDAALKAPDATPVTSVACAMGTSSVAATPLSPRASSPTTLAGEKEVEEALTEEMPATKEAPTVEEAPAAVGAPTEEEAPTTGKTPVEKETPTAGGMDTREEEASAEKMLVEGEEEASAVQAEVPVVPPPEVPITSDEGARASPTISRQPRLPRGAQGAAPKVDQHQVPHEAL
jgi:hypothetical protein